MIGKGEVRQKKRRLVITEKDKELLRLFEDWSYLTIEEMMILLDKAKQSIRWRVDRLLELGELRRSYEPIGRYIHYKGYTNSFKLQNYDHENACKCASVYLQKKLDCTITGSRRIKSELLKSKGVDFLGVKVPDLLLNKDGKKIAVEIELSQKKTESQKSNLLKYQDDIRLGLYVQVFYYCKTQAIKERIDRLITELRISGIKTAIMEEIHV